MNIPGTALPLEVLLWLGISLLVACAVLAIVIAMRTGHASGGEVRPREQVGDDTLAMVYGPRAIAAMAARDECNAATIDHLGVQMVEELEAWMEARS